MTARDWADLPMPAFEDLDPGRTIAILPTAAIEQHGPHLPVGTDTVIALGMLDAVRAECPDDLDLLILPVQAIGKSNEHLWAAGTCTLSAETALRAWTEIGLSVARAGIKKLLIINSHGGNLDLISILSRELRVQAGMLAVKAQWGAFGAPEGMFSDQENRFGIHGGDVETSLMLAFRPETVDMTAAQEFRSTAETTLISPIGPISYGWIAADLSESGVVGEAHLATAEKGHALAQHQARGCIALAQKMVQMPVPSAVSQRQMSG